MIIIEFNLNGLSGDNVENEELQLYKHYQTIVLTSIGRLNSRLKLIGNRHQESNDLIVTNTSRYLIEILYKLDQLKKLSSKSGFLAWKFDLIRDSVIRMHLNYLYDSGSFLIHLINESLLSLKNHDNNDQEIISAFRSHIEKCFKDLIDHVRSRPAVITVRVDLNDLQFLRTLLRTQFGTKCIIRQQLENDDIDDNESFERFIDLILRMFIRSYRNNDDDSMNATFSPTYYVYNVNQSNRLSQSTLLDGILIEIDQTKAISTRNYLTKNQSSFGSFKCALIEASLSADFDQIVDRSNVIQFESETLSDRQQSQFNVNLIVNMLDNLIEKHQINILFSQKVAHPSLKVYLSEQKNVLLLDRLGADLMGPLKCLSGSGRILNSAYHLDQLNSNNDSCCGFVKNLSIKQIGERTYLHLENRSESNLIQTMLVCIQDESYLREIEHLLKVAEATLQRALIGQYLVPGGPCFYSYCMRFIQQQSGRYCDGESSNKSMRFKFSSRFRRLFSTFFIQLMEKDSLHDYSIDPDSWHVFCEKNDELLRCECGLIERAAATTTKRSLERVDDLMQKSTAFSHDYSAADDDAASSFKISDIKHIKLVDCMESKLNAFKVARDILVTLLQIGVYIYDHNDNNNDSE